MASHDSLRTDASTVHRQDAAGVDQEPLSSAVRAEGLGKRDPTALTELASAEKARQTLNAEAKDVVDDDHPSDIERIAEARTVIRGSSRAQASRSDSAWPSADRTPAAVASVLLGKRLNHFFLEDFVGGGGMGAVFRAHDEQLDRTVAIKVIPFVGDDPDLKRRFRNEAQSAAKLDHPRIAKVFDVGNYEDWHYIVFEYIEGTNVRDLVNREGPLAIDDAVFFTCQLADAIQHAADRGIVHRDIKPSNVLIGEGDTIKLVDMGLARSENLDLSGDMTASGVTLGTFDYISPEQANDPRDADLRSDIYSLGCTLYFMLAGEPPYPGGTMLQKLLSHGKSPPPDVRRLNPEVSADLAAVIQKMLAKRPADRYQSATDLVADLQEVAHREGLDRAGSVALVTVSSLGPLSLLLERHAPWLFAMIILLLTSIFLFVIASLSRNEFAIVVPSRSSIVSLDAEPSKPRPGEGASSVLSPTRNPLTGNGGQRSATRVDESQDGTVPSNRANSGVVESNQRLDADPPRFQNLPLPDPLREQPTLPARSSGNAATNSMSIRPEVSRDIEAAREREDSSPPELERWKPRAIRVVSEVPDSTTFESGVDQYAYTDALSSAIAMASEMDVDRIEIGEPLIFSQPLKIERDGLVITSSVGGSVINFQTDPLESLQRVELMTIGSNRIEFEDIHFRWSVPPAAMGGGCLFLLNDNRLVRLTDCSVTIENPVQHPEVFAFDIVTKPPLTSTATSATVVDGSDAGATVRALPLVSIEMYNVCVRGQITMLRMDTIAELQLRWENGLLAVAGQMIDSAGAMEQPPPSARPVQLLLERLVVMPQRGFVRMRLDSKHPFPLQIDREARNCVFVVNPALPVVEVTGTDSLRNEPPVLVLRGETNAYDTKPDLSDTMLRLEDSQGAENVYTMADLRTNPPQWAEERSPRWAVDWASKNTKTTPVSQLRPADFRQYGAVVSGFNEQTLTIMTPLEVADLNE